MELARTKSALHVSVGEVPDPSCKVLETWNSEAKSSLGIWELDPDIKSLGTRNLIKDERMKIFFSVGEPSGDVHGANLIRQLRAQNGALEAVGFGGPRMAAAGCKLHADLTKLAIMFFLRAILNLHKFLHLLWRADRYFHKERPDAVVLVDYPGFNWWVAWRAKKRGIPVFYYGTPQLWAWASWRVRKMQRYVDHPMCKLPFEESWYRERGCAAVYIGHPYFDQLEQQVLDQSFLDQQSTDERPLVAVLPGSRTQEVLHNLPYFLRTIDHIRRQVSDVRFAIASFNEPQAALAREMVHRAGVEAEVYVDRTAELIKLADCCLACSGSVSLELLYHTKPSVILYWVSPFMFWLQGFFRTVRYITLVNLLASEKPVGGDLTLYDPNDPAAESVPFPEYLTYHDKSRQLARHITDWLRDPQSRQRRIEMLADLKARYGRSGASAIGARYILQTLQATPHVPRPHFLRQRRSSHAPRPV